MRRAIYLVHRWLGVLLSAFMLMWFVSGVVMLYVGYPKLTTQERLAHLPPLNRQACCASLDAILSSTADKSAVRSIRLTTVSGVPRAIVSAGRGNEFAVDAQSGRRIGPVGATDAAAAAQSFLPGVTVSESVLVQEDAWTHSRALDLHRPLHRFEMGDVAATTLYVSSRTGEVVRDASRLERNWNWVGAWIHWLYPFRGGALDPYWADIVIWLSIVSCVLVVLGAVVGVWRWRFKGSYRNGMRTPYRQQWMRWHHWIGLIFGATALTFIFSGLMSMNPFKVLDSGAPRLEQRLGQKNRVQADAFQITPAAALQAFAEAGLVARELEWRMVDGAPYYLALDGLGRTRLLGATAEGLQQGAFLAFDVEKMRAIGQSLMPLERLTEVKVLSEYDFYYYAREPHTMTGGVKHLPVLRLKFGDAGATWLHLDPATGAVVQQSDSRRRWGRWLFALLHSWDWLPLLERRPLWDFWMIALSIGGGILSLSGLVIAWRRVMRKARSVVA